jgi:tetratricopeptide (TPR) repeat protein
MRLAVALVLSTALVTPARAAGNDDEERARAHYEIGLGLYRLGDYQAALKEFAAGYELARKPGFLLNLGQTYRKLGELREARDMYRQFLAEVHLDDPARPQAQKVLAELEDAIRKQPPPSQTQTQTQTRPPPPSPPEPPAPSPPPVAVAPSPSPTIQVSAAPPRRSHRALGIAGVTVGIVGLGLVGGGIGTAVAADGLAKDLNAADQSGAAFDPAKDHAYTLDHSLSIGFLVGGAALAATGAILLIVSAR